MSTWNIGRLMRFPYIEQQAGTAVRYVVKMVNYFPSAAFMRQVDMVTFQDTNAVYKYDGPYAKHPYMVTPSRSIVNYMSFENENEFNTWGWEMRHDHGDYYFVYSGDSASKKEGSECLFHDWKRYNGMTDIYDYCTKCNKKGDFITYGSKV